MLLNFEWLTPTRRSINKQGITPDIEVDDILSNPLITIEGEGAAEGQVIEFVVDGEVIGSAVADEDGNFDFFQPFTRVRTATYRVKPSWDLDNDPALQIALATLLAEVGEGVATKSDRYPVADRSTGPAIDLGGVTV